MRGLNAVMSAFGGPIGIAITSLVLLTSYLNTVEEESKRVTQEIAQGFRGARQALDAFNKTPSAGAVDSLSEVPDQIEKIKARLVELRALGTEGLGDVSGSLAESIRLTNEEIKFNELRLVALSKGYDRAVQSVADMIQQTAGVQRPTAQARQEIVSLADSIVRSGVDMDTARPKIEALIEKLFGAEAAARAAAAGLRDIRASANLGGIADKLNEEIGKLRGDQSELLYGKAFRMREEFEQSLLKAEAGKAPREEVQRLRELNAERIRLTQENDRARESQRGVSRGHREAATEAKQQATEIKRLSEAQRQFREETARMVAANQGPLFAAQAAAAQAADAARRSAVTDKLNPVDLQVRLDAIDADFKRRVQEMIASGNQQLMQATGRYVEAATTEAAQKYQQTIDYFSSIGDGRGDVFKELFKTDVAKAELEQLDREVQTLFNNLQRQEQSLQTQVQSGLITEFTGRRELLRLYREQGGAIEALLPRMDGLARSIGDPSAVENVARVRSELERMQSTTNLLQQSIATTFQGSFSNLLNTLTEGTSSLRDAVTGFLLDMTRGIAQFAAAQTAQAAQAALLKRFGSGVDAAAGGAAAAVTATAITTATAAGAATLGTGIVTGAGAGGATIAAAVSTSAVAAATAIGVAITTAGATAAANMAAAIAGSSALTAGFADGGYTGPGSKYAPKGIVHAGEYVIRASSVRRYGMGLFDALNQGRYPHAPMRTIRAPRASYAEGGLVGGVSSPVLQQRIKVNSIFDINHVIRAVVKSSDFEREVVNVVNLNQHSIGR